MHISSFVNNPDDVSPHSNEYAAGTISSQPFADRKEIERSRSVIGAYMQSQIGTSYIDRSVLQKPKARTLNKELSRKNTRQEMNSHVPNRPGGISKHTFREPPSRGYNPYA